MTAFSMYAIEIENGGGMSTERLTASSSARFLIPLRSLLSPYFFNKTTLAAKLTHTEINLITVLNT